MLLVSPEKIAAVMALAPLPHSFAELDEMVSRELPAGALKATSRHICVSAEERRQLLASLHFIAFLQAGGFCLLAAAHVALQLHKGFLHRVGAGFRTFLALHHTQRNTVHE